MDQGQKEQESLGSPRSHQGFPCLAFLTLFFSFLSKSKGRAKERQGKGKQSHGPLLCFPPDGSPQQKVERRVSWSGFLLAFIFHFLISFYMGKMKEQKARENRNPMKPFFRLFSGSLVFIKRQAKDIADENDDETQRTSQE